MKWEHHVNKQWMAARQHDLTFSDIKTLIPVTATGRARKITEEDYLKVYGSCFGIIDDDTCTSYGAAARGHIMEPYAVDFWNKKMTHGMNHWDDVVIWGICPGTSSSIAFSPDALDISMDDLDEEERRDCSVFVENLSEEPKRMLEIKSYETGNHLICGYTPTEKLQERWQIAMGMLVCPTIEVGSVLFFDPRCEQGNFVHTYQRYDLQDEIDMLAEAAKGYYEWLNKFTEGKAFVVPKALKLGVSDVDEEQVHQEYLESKEHSLDPF